MFGLKPKPIEHENLLQPFIKEIGLAEHHIRFKGVAHGFPHNEREGRGISKGVAWTAVNTLPSGLKYGFSVYSDTRRLSARGNENATVTLELSLKHPKGQYQSYTWKTDGTGSVISQKTVPRRTLFFFKGEDVESRGRPMEQAEARKLISLAKRFAITGNLPLLEGVENAERERTRLAEGIKNIHR